MRLPSGRVRVIATRSVVGVLRLAAEVDADQDLSRRRCTLFSARPLTVATTRSFVPAGRKTCLVKSRRLLQTYGAGAGRGSSATGVAPRRPGRAWPRASESVSGVGVGPARRADDEHERRRVARLLLGVALARAGGVRAVGQGGVERAAELAGLAVQERVGDQERLVARPPHPPRCRPRSRGSPTPASRRSPRTPAGSRPDGPDGALSVTCGWHRERGRGEDQQAAMTATGRLRESWSIVPL